MFFNVACLFYQRNDKDIGVTFKKKKKNWTEKLKKKKKTKKEKKIELQASVVSIQLVTVISATISIPH